MTTIIINTKEIRNAVALTANYTAKANDFQGQVIISGRDGSLSVKATDYVEAVEVRAIAFTCSDLTTDSFETFAVDAKKLLAILKSTKTENLSIEIAEKIIFIVSEHSRIKLEKFAEVQKITITAGINSEEIKLSNELIDGLNHVYHAVDTVNPKASLNGVLLQLREERISFVATDSKRLAIVDSNIGCDINRDSIIPKRGILSINKLFSGYELVAKIDDHSVTVEASNLIYSVKLVNDKFPDYKRIIPNNYKQKLILNRLSMKALIEEASIFDKELNFMFKDGTLKIRDLSGNTEVNYEYGENIPSEINFSIVGTYIIEFLDSISSEEFELGFNYYNLPIVLSATNEHMEICMPIVSADIKTSSEEGDVKKVA